MLAPAIPIDEVSRLNMLLSLNILDTPPEERFERFVKLSQRIFKVPIVLISLVDKNRMWFKSCHGLSITEAPRSISFCAHAILSNEVFVIPDAALDPRFADNPLVVNSPYIRFYAGQPLKANNVAVMGTLCIIDTKPRKLSQTDFDILRDLAALVESELNSLDTVETTQALLRNTESILSATINNTMDAVIQINSAGIITFWNIQAEKIFGWMREQAIGQIMHEMIIPPRYRNAHIHGMNNSFFSSKWPAINKRLEIDALHRDGHEFPIELSITSIKISDKLEFSAFIRDISERKKAEEELHLAAMVYQHSNEAMLVINNEWKIDSINPAFTEITGYKLEEVIGRSAKLLLSGRDDREFYKAMVNTINTTGYWQGEVWNRRKNGEAYLVWLTITAINEDDGSLQRYVSLFSDITQKKESEKLIWQQANFDSLTGLLNRRMFHDRLEQEIMKSHRSGLPMALLLLDLDRFKEVNDALGHAPGDMLLVEAARRITECVGESDVVARLGGDEFTIILSELKDVNSVERIAQNLIACIAVPFHLLQEQVYVSASVGIALYPSDGGNANSLLKNADQAMYLAKSLGRNRFNYFTADLQESAQARMYMINDLRKALVGKQLEVYYQPIVEITTGKIVKAEALLRWKHPELCMVSPMQFIPLAEQSGLIHEIGDWVFYEATRELKRWRERFVPDFQLSVNKSPVQIRQSGRDHASLWLSHLRTMGLPGQSIVIEITESLLLNAEINVIEKLLMYRDAGVHVALDDFGTGYSSLSYIKKFNIDYIKIDQSFVCNMEKDTNDQILCEAIIVMTHKLGLKVIAEGVETEQQRDMLTAYGCDYAQGWLYSKAVPAEQFEVLLQKQVEQNSTSLYMEMQTYPPSII